MNLIRIYKVVVIVVLFGIANMSLANEGIWSKKTDMPTARFGPTSSVVNGKVYVIGGGATMYGSALSTVEEYDPATDTWTRKAPMPTPRYGHAACVVNNKIYVFGGSRTTPGFLVTVEEYDPATDAWTTKRDMPTKRTFLCASVVNNKIYVIGGRAASDPPDPGPSSLEVYDPATDTWTTKANMPIRRASAAACVVDGKVYVIGGVIEDTHGAPLSTVNEYNPATDIWTRKADMPTARLFLSATVVNGKIYAFGGAVYGGPVLSTVEKYDPATDTWTIKPDMLTKRAMLSTSEVNGKIYALGGTGLWYPWTGISTVEEYDIGLSPSSPDFNGDGIVDAADMCIMVKHWLTEDPLCDIAPPPFGDGIVDVQDLVLLSEHLFEEILPPELVAYWKFDETEGAIAYELVGGKDSYLIGDPVWQPDDGIKDGALQFDGIDDYVLSTFNSNPAHGPFSVFGWIKGGAPGQAIISQMDGSGNGETWLGIDSLNGCLMTGLVAPPIGRFISQPLESNKIITDDIWHHIGFVWDGSYRILYVDGIEVAKDTNPFASLKNSDGGLYIGVNKNLNAGTFFAGLIDDVRIYDVALTAEKIAVLAQ